MTISTLLQSLHAGQFDAQLTRLGCLAPRDLPAARRRAAEAVLKIFTIWM